MLTLAALNLKAEVIGQGQLATATEEQGLQQQFSAYRGVDADYVHAGATTLERWMDWKWGLRIHWGLYCMFDGGESWILVKPTPKPRDWQMNYYASYQQFNPTNFNADEWMRIMAHAGMRYFSFTSKHHEGFCLWPTKTLQKGFRKKADGSYEDVVDHYSIAETPYKKDIIADLVKAGRAHNLGVSLYYSHIDWHDWDFAWDSRNFWYDPQFTKESDPKRWAAFIKKERDQITELLTGYGPIDTLCLDISWPKEARAEAYDVAKLARQLQPNIMLRNRGINEYGDYETPEQTIPGDPNNMKRPWQVIYPGSSGFSYKKNDTYKPREWVLESLIDIVSKGGNFQVGFGPDPTGKWPQEMIERVSYVGAWLKVNGECIYATRPYLRYHEGTDLRFTRTKDKKYLYIISLKWPGEALHSKLARVREGSKVRLLGYDHDLAWRREGEGVVIDMPKELQEAAKRPSLQAYAFKVESEPWEKFSATLPEEPPLPTQSKKKKSTTASDSKAPAHVSEVVPQLRFLPSGTDGKEMVSSDLTNPGVTVRYTLDGSDPDATSPVFSSPVSLAKGQVLKARAFGGGASADHLATAIGGAIRINFQILDNKTPAGFLPDSGEPFAKRTNGRTYGWSMDVTKEVRRRGPGEIKDTFCHFRKGVTWEIEVPNASYVVTVGVGDFSHESRNTINVEGVIFFSSLELSQQTAETTKTVEVKDGKLTIDCGDSGDRQTKITFVSVAAK
ncbi:MAG: alpha-L-fucosidase [Verrucomicrobiota bacterium]